MNSSFAERLKELRLEKGLTQVQLAKELDGKIAQSTIALWENEKRTPTMDCLIILAQYFGVSIDYLVGLEY